MALGENIIKDNKNSNTKDLSSDLSDVTLEISPKDIKEVCSQWNSKITSIDLSSIDVESVFSSLISVGVGTSYFPSLKKALAKAEKMVSSTSNLISTASQEQEGIQNYYGNRQGNNNYYGTPTGSSGSSDSNSYGSNSGITGTDFNIPSALEDIPGADDEIEEEDVIINTEFIDKINELDAESYIEFMKALGNIDEGLLPYLVDSEYASKLKKYLLEAPNISDDLKKIISQMDENELQVTLLSIVTDESAITDVSKSIIYKYTTLLSEKDELKDINKSQIFLKSVDIVDKFFDTTLKSDKVQEELLKVYEGNSIEELDDFSVAFVKTAIDELCEKNNIDYETLLTDPKNADKVKKSVSDLSKSLSYFKAVNSLGDEAAVLIYDSLIQEDGSDSKKTNNI